MLSIKSVYKIGAGPSSSHTMGPEKACIKFKEAYRDVKKVHCNLFGSLALTGKGHLTDYIINETLKPIEVKVEFHPEKSLERHENAMELIGTLQNDEIIKWVVYSVGGGEILIDEISNKEDEKYDINSMKDITKYMNENNMNFYEFILNKEPEILVHIEKVWIVMKKAIKRGIEAEGDLPGALKLKRKAKDLYEKSNGDSDLIISAYAHAVNEENASGGEIVTAPTCGACGVLPAILKYHQDKYDLKDEKIHEALIVAAVFGNVVKKNASISGAEAGCQAEIGTATSMAAAAVMHLKNGTNKQIEAAAKIAMEHQLGLTCDPIMGFVQIPCIQRNAVGAIKAKLAVKLAFTDDNLDLIDFDTIVKTMYETGKDMAKEYRETSTGGLAKYYKMKSELE